MLTEPAAGRIGLRARARQADYGGTVGVDSAGLQTGATFWVTVPAATADEERSQLSEVVAQPVVTLQGVSVLVVDDDGDARDLMVAVLKEYGASVRAVPSAVDALELLRDHARGRDREPGTWKKSLPTDLVCALPSSPSLDQLTPTAGACWSARYAVGTSLSRLPVRKRRHRGQELSSHGMVSRRDIRGRS